MTSIRAAFSVSAVILAVWNARADEARTASTNALAPVELHDQYGTPQKLSFPATNVTVLVIADKKGSAQVEAWIAALKPRYGARIDIRGIADVRGAPEFLHDRIRKKFQSTRGYPVMMDWSGNVCAQFGYQPGVANILVLGCDGVMLARFSGAASGSSVNETCTILDKALASSSKAAR